MSRAANLRWKVDLAEGTLIESMYHPKKWENEGIYQGAGREGGRPLCRWFAEREHPFMRVELVGMKAICQKICGQNDINNY